ncbi:DUF4097 family beta strand repeat-containing protein [Lysinibacillus sp. ZYM-1]|uniref:DUF4097 family beta strand repeat-containing protein n=1 Tax=Lysinibacillus sp. ZYM-1 TaxID=1681184 RepID=UPI0006CE8F5B|nr:DUF4097 family beta strand repeat-containing protein [Lysinibacillus sp. ZYM-1]KPN95346.1 hypothetical protein AO843_03980 [Lysinibacillus sp. ZYM-1]
MTSKNTLIAMTMIALGILLALVGYFSGGRWLFIKDDDGLHVPGSNKLVSESHNLDKFTNINIVNDYGDIVIVASDDKYKLETNVLEQQDVSYHVEDGTLRIETKAKKKNSFQFGLASFSSPSIKLYVPTDTKLETIVIDSEFGDTSLSGLHYQQLTLIQNYGDITFNDITGEKTEITQDFGDLTFKQYASNGVNIESQHGDIDIVGTLNGSSTITSSFGDATFHLQNNQSDLGYEVKTSFGDITINGTEQSGTVTQRYNGDHQLNISLSHGDVDVSLK